MTTQPTDEQPQRKRWITLIAVIVIAAAILIFVLSRRPSKETAAAPTAPNSSGTVKFLMEQQWRIRMKLALVEQQAVARQISATGRVIPAANHHAVVAPPVGGIITRGSLPRIGQRVSAGQLIATLQQTATSAEQSQVRAAAAQAESQNAQVALEAARFESERRAADGEVEAARARLELARRESERTLQLYNQQIIPRQQLDISEADLKTAQASYDSAVARRHALDSVRRVPPVNVESDKSNANHEVKSPISGVVTSVSKSIGERVAPGEAILEITNLETVWIEAPIFERDLGLLAMNRTATFNTAAYPGRSWSGSLIDLGAVIDEQKRAAMVIFAVTNRDRALRIGMQANIRLDADESVTAMMIPREAVLDDEGKKIVYVLLSGEEFQRREVKLGDEYGERAAVLEGLHPGERVVTQGALQLKLQELSPADAGAHTHET